MAGSERDPSPGFSSPPDRAGEPGATLELLAPAGDPDALEAAIEAGADAVYFGLTALSARRRARNFTDEELQHVVRQLHGRGVRAYLTVNIDLAERELEQAAGMLQQARRAGVDAVLVRDPALLALRDQYPELEFHFSTQTSITSSADVAAAAALGADRVVLARELTLPEIAAASAVPGVQTEVFVQGALCFCVSGRCLMSSWVGGRSGNRGACTSPCRVPWSLDGQPAGTPLSMHDLAAIERLDDLRAAGVAALKIEGRMKNAAWVRQAVQLYRRALAGQAQGDWSAALQHLGQYTGRQMTCGYLDGRRDGLTGPAGRPPATDASEEAIPEHGGRDAPRPPAATGPSTYDLELTVQARGVLCRCRAGGTSDTWTIPKTVVRRPRKAVSIQAFFARLSDQPLAGFRPGRTSTNQPEFLLVPRAANALIRHISKMLLRSHRKRMRTARVELPAPVLGVLEHRPRCPANRMQLGDPPNRVRLDVDAVPAFLDNVQPEAVIVEGLTPDRLKRLRGQCGRTPIVAALPPVFFEDQIAAIEDLLTACRRSGVTVEVNSWGGWQLARRARVRMEGGPGLAALNSLAARTLGRLGLRAVTLSPEADRHKLAQAAAHCPVPCSLVVFGRPPLMITRAELPADYAGTRLADRRRTEVTARREQGLWVLRPLEPFDLRGQRNQRIGVKHLVVDLVGSPDPLREWHRSPAGRKPSFHFNYDRRLF